MLRKMISDMKKEKQRKERRKMTRRLTITAVSGIAAGLASGVLLAPKSGKETRKDIADAANEINVKLKDKADTAKDNIHSKGLELKSNISDAREKISSYLSERKSQAAVEASCESCDEVTNDGEVKLNNNCENN